MTVTLGGRAGSFSASPAGREPGKPITAAPPVISSPGLPALEPQGTDDEVNQSVHQLLDAGAADQLYLNGLRRAVPIGLPARESMRVRGLYG